MALDVGEFQVHLVVDDLLAAFLVHDGIERSGEHQVGADFLAGVLAGLFGGVAGLARQFVTQFGAFFGVGHKVGLARIDEGAFHVLHEGFHVDVFVALVADLADDHRRNDSVLLLDHGLVPGTVQAVGNHLVGHQAGVGVVPGAGKVGDGVFVDTGDLLATGAAHEGGETCAKAECQNLGHSFLLFSGLKFTKVNIAK